MNFALSDEQVLLREAARGSLSRVQDHRGRPEALEDPSALPDLWPTAVEAGWPGLLIGEEHGGAGLGAFDALLVAEECGRVLAAVPLLGLLPASAILDAAGDESLAAVAGRRAAAGVRARRVRPASSSRAGRSKPRSGYRRVHAPHGDGRRFRGRGRRDSRVRSGRSRRRSARGRRRRPPMGCPSPPPCRPAPTGVEIEAMTRYDATRSLAHVTLQRGHAVGGSTSARSRWLTPGTWPRR